MFCGITLLLSLFVFSNSQCVNVQQNVTYYTSKGEQIRWRADSLIKGNGLTYTLTPSSSIMRYHPAFDQISTQEEHYSILSKVYALRAYDIASTGAWTNQFAFLEKDEAKSQYDIYYTAGLVTQMDTTPQFIQKVKLTKEEPNLDCYDLEYINPELWIVDCAERKSGAAMENYIYIVNKTDNDVTSPSKRIQTPNHKNYTSIKGRKIQYHVYYKQDIGDNDQLDIPAPKNPIRIMLRGQQAFNSENGTVDNLDTDCSIDVILRTENGTTYDTGYILDKTRISTDTKRTVNFTLIDFKIMPNGDVYILDAYEGIYVYRVTEIGDWKYIKTIQTMIGRAYAFDVNNRLLNDGFSYLHIAVVYQSNMLTFIADKQQNGYSLPFNATYPISVSLSQQYVIIVHDQYMYLYNSEKPYLLHKELLISQTILVNPYAPDAVVISNMFTRRYELSDGYIASENSIAIEQNSLTFSATDGKNTCKVTITYQVLQQNNTQLFPLGHDPFPTMITYPAIPFILQDIASGPNLQFTTPDIKNTHVEMKVHFLWELDVKNISWFEAQDVIYADVLVDPHHETTNKFYLFLQHKNKTAIVWDCLTINYNDKHCTCEKEVEVDLPLQLSRQNSQFGWNSFDKDDLTFQFLANEYEIFIYDSYEGKPTKIGNISYAQKPEYKITSFTALKKNVFIVHRQAKEIDVVSSIYPKLYSFPIDAELIDSYETGCSWTPIRVYGDPITKSELVFILTEDCVFIGDQRYHFTLIDAIHIRTGAEVEIAVGEKTFYIISTLKGEDQILEYNYENLNDIYLMKNMPLYDRFKLQTPLTIDFAFETGFLFIRALDTKENETVFLIYESNILYRDCLHKVLRTHELIPDGQLVETAASGFDQMFVYFNDLKTQHIVVVLRDSLMELTPTEISDAYTTQLNAAVSVSNTFTENVINVKYPVKFINTQSIVRVNNTILNQTDNKFDSIATQQYINLTNNGWYWGHVTRFTIDCRQCETHLIDILNPVTHGSEGSYFANYEFVAGSIFQNSAVYLTDQSLIFQNDNDTLKFVQKIENVQYCNQLTTYNQFIMISCVNSKAEALIIIYNCDLTNSKCTLVEPQSQVLTGVQLISKMVYMNSILFILDQDQSNPRHYQGSLHVYSLNLDNQWSIKNEQIINATYFSLTSDSEFYISDFDAVQFQIGNTNYYKIMIQTTVEKTYFVQMYNDNGLLKYNHKDSFNLANALNNDYAIKSDTYFYQIRSQKSSVSNNILSITALITTNNVAQYAVTFQFDVSDPLNKGSPVKNSITVPYLLNHYGTFTAINKLTIGQGHAAVAYTNYTHLLIAIYKLPDLTIEGEEVVTKMLTMTGSEVVEYWRPGTNFVLVLQKDPIYGEPVMYANLFESKKTSNHLLVKYTIHDFPRLIIYDGNKVDSQTVELGIANDFSSSVGKFQIVNKGKPVPPSPDDDKGSSLLWLWILLGVLGGLLIFGGVGYFVYQKYQRRGPVVTDSAKVSLMQQ